MATALSAPRHGSASLIPEAHGRPRAIVEFPQSLHMSTWPLIKSLLSSVTRCTNSKQVSFRPNTVSVTKCTKTSTPECGYAILTAGPFVTKSTKNVESRGSRRQNRSDILRDAQKFRTSGDVSRASSAEFVDLVTLRLRNSLPEPGRRRGLFVHLVTFPTSTALFVHLVTLSVIITTMSLRNGRVSRRGHRLEPPGRPRFR